MSSAAGEPSAERPGRPDDHDPARLVPPADPWLEEVPTSVLGEVPSSDSGPPAGHVPPDDPVPPADTARFDDAAPVEGAVSFDGPPSGWVAAPPPRGRRGRRVTRWAVVVLAVVALFVAGMLARDQFGSGSGGGDRDALGSGPSAGPSRGTVPAATSTGSGRQPTPAVTAAPAESVSGPPSAQPDSSAGGQVVVYEVTASGSDNTGSVSYTDQDGDIIRRNGIPLPWRVTFSLGAGRKPPLVLISQRKGGGDAGPVTCTITLAGKVLSVTTAEGRYASAQCSG